MNAGAGIGLRATVRDFLRKTPDRAVVISSNKRAAGPIAEALAHVKKCSTVMNLISAAGGERLWVVPYSGLDRPLATSAATAEQSVQCAEVGMREGDPLLVINPREYLTVSSSYRGRLVQRELWKIFIKQAFPGFAGDLAGLQRETEKKAPEFSGHFIVPLFFFAARVAAMEAHCRAFALADSDAELFWNGLVTAITADSLQPDRMTAALFSGLMFAHVFGFELFPETKEIAEINLRSIKALMAGVLKKPQIGETEDLARAILAETLVPGQTPPDIRLTGYRDLIMYYWGGALTGGGES